MKLEYVSTSTVETWRDCQMKWYLGHDGSPRPELKGDALLYGSAIHDFAEKQALKLGAMKNESASRPKDAVTKTWQSDAPYPPGFAARWAADQNTVTRWLRSLFVDPSYDYEVERRLEHKLSDDLTFVGYIDFLRTGEGEAFILDYKTTKQSKWRKPAKSSLQLKAYAAVISKQFDIRAERVTCALGFLQGELLDSVVFTQRQLDSAMADIVECADVIRNTDKASVTPSQLCQYCDFRERCAHWIATVKENEEW